MSYFFRNMDAQKAKKKITEIMPLKPVIARLCLQILIASAEQLGKARHSGVLS